VHAGADIAAQRAAEDALQAAIVDASGDELLRQMGSVVRAGLRAMRPISRMQTLLAHESDLADYGKIVRAIEASDAEAAKAAMMQLLSHSADQLLGEAV
jgi:DNA-binding FadR family transcriptional regulator